jgi:hypothetical protein
MGGELTLFLADIREITGKQPGSVAAPRLRPAPIWARPWAKAGLLLLAGVALAAGWVFFAGRVTTVRCAQIGPQRVDCAIESRLLGVWTVGQTMVHEVQRASVGEWCDKRSCGYRVDLATKSGNQPVTWAYSGDSAPKQAMADRINTFFCVG